MEIVFCEIYHNTIHGRSEKINKEIYGHWIVIDHYENIFPREISFHNDGYESELSDDSNLLVNDVIDLHRAKYIAYENSQIFVYRKHPYIRNYRNIVCKSNYIKPQIAEIIELNKSSNDLFYSVAIIKTFWLRLVQRNWRRVYKERIRIKALRCNAKSIFYREMHGKWPNSCIHYPGLKYMLNL